LNWSHCSTSRLGHPAIKSLYAKREMLIMAYFTCLYCGRMTSTQQSESTNRVLKDGFVNNVTSLHQFAETCWKCYSIWITLTLRRVLMLRYELGFKSGLVTVWYGMWIVTTCSIDICNCFIMCLQHRHKLFSIVMHHSMINWYACTRGRYT
jgi:hypothetical protein